MDIIVELSDYICGIQQDKALAIAFDGVDASGKTTLANQVSEALVRRGKNCVRISIDKFHNPRAIRLRKGELSPEGFFYDSFNLDKIVEYVLEPLRKGEGSLIDGIYDYKADRELERPSIPVTSDLIVLFDGVFLHRDELACYWDMSIFLDVSFDTVLQRAIERDAELFGSAEEVRRRYVDRYIPGERIYLSSCYPAQRATIVIDNNDFNNKRIIKAPYPRV